MEEPWDELMGPPAMGGTNTTHPIAPDPSALVRNSQSTASPPAAVFRNQPDLNASGSAIALPRRWSQHAEDPSASQAATAQAVYMASNAAVLRSESMGSAFDNDAAMDESGPFDTRTSTDDDKSVDSDIGREYDERYHDSIRQEALRMLEVADADAHYSVHRTITGGFTAQAKSMGSQRRTKSALQALNVTAQRSQRRPVVEYSIRSREDQEYGETGGVVDMEGLEARSAASSAETGATSPWSSRYSMDNTLLALTGGSMKRPWYTDAVEGEQERLSAANLFRNSPVKSTQIFGSGFAFRQQHVFGKQSATAERNIHDGVWKESSSPMNNPRLKTWQDQLLEKKRKQRRCAFILVLILFCIVIPFVSIWSARSKQKQSISSESNSGSTEPASNEECTFFVTSNIPYNDNEEVLLKQQLALVRHSAQFVVHLGNIQEVVVTQCDSDAYTEVANLIEDASPVAVFVVPGEDDWNNCPDPDKAWNDWVSTFELFNQRWAQFEQYNQPRTIIDGTPTTVFRQNGQLENWAFLHHDVLFIGVHVVGGTVPDQSEFDQRNDNNYAWVVRMSQQHESEIRAVVVFGNGEPTYQPNIHFFAEAATFWHTYTKPTLYVHASSNGTNTRYYKPYENLSHVWAAAVVKTADDSPVRIQVGTGDQPFTVSVFSV
jgi:hypothetical protein